MAHREAQLLGQVAGLLHAQHVRAARHARASRGCVPRAAAPSSRRVGVGQAPSEHRRLNFDGRFQTSATTATNPTPIETTPASTTRSQSTLRGCRAVVRQSDRKRGSAQRRAASGWKHSPGAGAKGAASFEGPPSTHHRRPTEPIFRRRSGSSRRSCGAVTLGRRFGAPGRSARRSRRVAGTVVIGRQARSRMPARLPRRGGGGRAAKHLGVPLRFGFGCRAPHRCRGGSVPGRTSWARHRMLGSRVRPAPVAKQL